MKDIYKGTLYEDNIVSPRMIDRARLYNLATQTKVDMVMQVGGKCDIDGTKNEDGGYNLFNIRLKPSATAAIPQGIYNLELFSVDEDNNPIIEAYYTNFARVLESSFRNGN